MDLDFGLVDADNHYYESADAFLRHGDERVRRYVRWVEDGSRRYLLFGDERPTAVLNPTFNKVARPGAFHRHLTELEAGARGMREAYGELVPLPPECHDRGDRLAAMDSQGVERAFFFPSLGLTVEGHMGRDPDLLYAVMHAFNEWLDEDWGFCHAERIYAPPVIPLLEVEHACRELDWALARGARLVSLRPGPAYGRSPADPYFDPFWARIDEAGVVAAYHATAGKSPYDAVFDELWMQPYPTDAEYASTLRAAIHPLERPIMDTLTALILGNLFGRFPRVRVASIEMGSIWVGYLLHALDHAGGLLTRTVRAFGTTVRDRPSDVFAEHVWVAPFPEDDIAGLVELIGAGHVLMGSDWPHAEGTPLPADFAAGLAGLDASTMRAVMRDNALGLVAAR